MRISTWSIFLFFLAGSSWAQKQEHLLFSSFGKPARQALIPKEMPGKPVSYNVKHTRRQAATPTSGAASVSSTRLVDEGTILTMAANASRPMLSYDQPSKTLAFVHRGGLYNPAGLDGVSSNRLFYALNTKNGHPEQWQLGKGPVYDNDPYVLSGTTSYGARYPMLTLINPAESPDTNQVMAVMAAPVLADSNGNWGGITRVKRAINNDTANGKVTKGNFYWPNSIAANAQGHTYILEVIANADSVIPQYSGKLRLMKGVAPSASQPMTWTEQIINLPVVSSGIVFSYSNSVISFARNSQVGYITLLCRLQDQTRCPFSQTYPVVLYTLDGGNTWSAPYVGNATYSSDFAFARKQLRGDSAYNNSGILRRVAYSTAFEHDAAVDSIGNLHFFLGLSPSGLVNDTELPPDGAIYPSWLRYYDVILNPAQLQQNQWNVVPVYRPQAYKGGWGDISGTEHIPFYHRPQVSLSPTGSKIVFGVYDTDTADHFWIGDFNNLYPNLKACAFRIEGNNYLYSRVFNLTDGCDLDGPVVFGTLSDRFAQKEDSLILFQVSGLPVNPGGGVDPGPATADLFFSRISWKPPLYTSNPPGIDSGFVHSIYGRVVEDVNLNCQVDLPDRGLKKRWVKVGNQYITTNKYGYYWAGVPNGTHTVQVLKGPLDPDAAVQCVPNLTLPPFTVQADSATSLTNQNIPVTQTNCSRVTVKGAYSRLRPCRRTTLRITVSNTGNKTVLSPRTSFRHHRWLTLLSSSRPLTWHPADSTWSFVIDSLSPDSSVQVLVVDSVSCTAAQLGYSMCTPLSVSYEGECAQNGNWDGSALGMKARCNGSVPIFTILNHGLSMSDSLPYRLYKDSLFVFKSKVKLVAQDSLVIQVPNAATTSNYRLEVLQSGMWSHYSFTSAEIQCGSGGPPVVIGSNNSGTTACDFIRNSFDPNDKQVWPAGAGTLGKILPTSWLEYKIRFMNKGNDTAFKVVVIDTLATDLDMNSFTEMVASHPYKLTVGGQGNPVLSFRFDDINLPDSATNQDESRGFVVFRIRPKTSSLPGTQIRNRAGIYFDFNPPVMTHYTLNTLFDPPYSPGISDSVVIITAKNPATAKEQVLIYPNPNTGRFSLKGLMPGQVQVLNALGQQILQKEMDKKAELDVDLSASGKGIYLVRICTDAAVYTYKVVVR